MAWITTGWMAPSTALAHLLTVGLRPGPGAIRFFIEDVTGDDWVPLDLVERVADHHEIEDALDHRFWKVEEFHGERGIEALVFLKK